MAYDYNKEYFISLYERHCDMVYRICYFYLSNKDWENFGESILVDGVLDLNKVYLYMKKQDTIEPHLLKPIYIKKIEVENG